MIFAILFMLLGQSIMNLTPGESIRVEAIKRANEGEKPTEIYHSLKRSKKLFYKWLKRY